MDRRIAELSECKKQRKLLRRLFRPRQDASQSTPGPPLEETAKKPSIVQNEEVFNSAILEDLLAAAPLDLLKPVFGPPLEPCQSSLSRPSTSNWSLGSSAIGRLLDEQPAPKCPFGDITNEYYQLSRTNHTKSTSCGFVNCHDCNQKQYGFHDIARGARGITYHKNYECLVCHQTNSHSHSYLDQIICASKHGRDRTSVDDSGLTPAQALITISRTNMDGTPETSAQTCELFRALFPQDDADLRKSLRIHDPAGRSLVSNIKSQGFTEILDYISTGLGINLNEPSAPIQAESNHDQERRQSTYISTSSLKERLPQYSTRYLKNIARLIKVHSITNSSVIMTNRLTSSLSVTATELGTSGQTLAMSNRTSTANLAGEFLTLDHHIKSQGICISGLPAHDLGTCWCHLVEGLDQKIWVNRHGLVSDLVMDPPPNLANLDIYFKDNFGNNILHMLAARGSDIATIMNVLEQGVDGNAKNTSGQTFLHVFRYRVLRDWAVLPHLLIWILQRLITFNINFQACDPFGQTFAHILTNQARHISQASFHVTRLPLNVTQEMRRDALGWIPNFHTGTEFSGGSGSKPHEFRQGFLQHRDSTILYGRQKISKQVCPGNSASVVVDDIIDSVQRPPEHSEPPSPAANISYSPESDNLVLTHISLLRTAGSALDFPLIEDAEGRNGLHCLAEASLAWNLDLIPVPEGRSNKRKAGQRNATPSKRLSYRFELVKNMIAAGADINHYNCKGETVLMAFITHLLDGEADKTLTDLLHYLVHKGANIHRRNRAGETALHIAVRLGRKVATKVLLMNGANVHARDSDGQGVLVVGEKRYLQAHGAPLIYAPIMACMALCIQYGAIASPTPRHEWSIPE